MGLFAKQLSTAEKALAEGNLALAEKVLKPLLRSAPRHSRANELMAYVAGNRGDEESLLRFLKVATATSDASATSWHYLGVLHLRKHRLPEAEACFRTALRMHSDFFEAWHELGRTLHEKGDFPDALAAFGQATGLNPQSYEVHHNSGRALYAAGQFEEALRRYDQSIELAPASADPWLNRGEVLHDLNRMDLALASYARAQALRPGFSEARANEALTRLITGDWDAGWQAFEARWSGAAALQERHAQIPRWRGDASLHGKRVLIWCEQGFGDTLQFCRFVPRVLEQSQSVVFEVQPPLQPLLQSNFDCEVVSVGGAIPQCDLQIPLMSLPLALKATLDNLPGVPYLKPEPERLAHWRSRLMRTTIKPRIAIATSGRSTYKHETRRQVSLRQFECLAQRCHLFLTQKDLTDDDRRTLSEKDFEVDFLGDEIEDFRDGAAIVANVDLVITVDTSLAHLAGALGKPVWLLLAEVPDWRWMLRRQDSPWYPNATLFRQQKAGDWEGVFAEVCRQLDEQFR
jgi:tetratricopeptide (TPR) repeat protein